MRVLGRWLPLELLEGAWLGLLLVRAGIEVEISTSLPLLLLWSLLVHEELLLSLWLVLRPLWVEILRCLVVLESSIVVLLHVVVKATLVVLLPHEALVEVIVEPVLHLVRVHLLRWVKLWLTSVLVREEGSS